MWGFVFALMKCSNAAFGEQNKTDNDSKCQQVYKSLKILQSYQYKCNKKRVKFYPFLSQKIAVILSSQFAYKTECALRIELAAIAPLPTNPRGLREP